MSPRNAMGQGDPPDRSSGVDRASGDADAARPNRPATGPCAHLPIPPAVRRLRVDARGYPVPVVVPWVANQPRFSSVSAPRTYLVGALRLCAVCGLGLAPGERYYANNDADDVEFYEAARSAGVEVVGRRSLEAGGHRECILFAAIACPYLSGDTARSRVAVHGAYTAPKGERRGDTALVTGSSGYELRVDDEVGPVFHLGPLQEWHRYQQGVELVDELVRAIDAAPRRALPDNAIDLADRKVLDAALVPVCRSVAETGAVPALHRPRPPRNAPCGCGSGRKFKACHGRG